MAHSVVILLVLIVVSGLLSSLEIAISSSNRGRVKVRADGGDKKAARLLATIDDPHNFFATTQLYITFIAFFSGAYAASSFTDPLVAWIQKMGLPIPENIAEPVAFLLITATLTYVSLIAGELVPKRLAMKYAIPYAANALPVLNVLSILALPAVKFLAASARFALRLIRFKDETAGGDITKEEIRLIVESGSEQGQIAESEHGMIENIFVFDKLTAGDICTHRLDVVGIPISANFQTVVGMLTGEFYTRLPVYEEHLDKVCGILYTKDILRYMAANPDRSGFEIKTLMREPYFVPISKKSDELFQEMRRDHVYIAVVIDEYGGTTGIVTMADLVEKIVGRIHDEYDTNVTPDIAAIDERTFRIQGVTGLKDVQDHIGVPLPTDDYETLSGFLIGLLGRIPADNERPELIFGNLLFKVERVREKRIATVRVIKSEDEEYGTEGGEIY
ncbi:MAG: hemolysin family protein [Chitinispirillia bacterium]|nr:hemolysin family protein [Chitinispirillia bacterium]MCL2242580.1 hemolysin family protein [Chitinispirillia bacterium]